MAEQPTPRPLTGPRLLLGAFIVWQLVFLFGVNFLEIINSARSELPTDKDYKQALGHVVPGWASKKGHVHDLADLGEKAMRRYAQLTGQTQGWSLFAPDVTRHCVFPAVVVRWDDPRSAAALAPPLTPLAATGPVQAAVLRAAVASAPEPAAARSVTIRSENEPGDIQSYFRVGHFRLRRLEGNLVLVLRRHNDETAEEAAERWRRRIFKLLDEDGDVAKAYLRWRWESYRQAHPDAPEAKQLILVMRRYQIAGPEQAPPPWRGPYTEPVARWLPHPPGAPLEMYNPVTRRFQEVKQ